MPAKTTIEQIMTKDLFTVELEDPVKKADEFMREQNIRHVPVVDNKKFVGLITQRSLSEYTLRQIYEFDDNIEEAGQNKVSDFRNILEKNVHVVYPEDTVSKAVQLMAKKKMDCLPVCDWSNNLVGILTSTDLLLYFNKKLNED